MPECLCEEMQVVVLMGGLGTRLKEYTHNRPKPMVEIEGKPFFEYQLRLMKLAGFRKFVFCLGYRAEMVESYFGDGHQFGVEITYSYDGPRLLGTGGAIRKALPLLEQDFMLIYGDSFMDINYFEVVVRYRNGLQAGKKALMTIMKNCNRFDCSNVVCEQGEILLYDKKVKRSDMQYIDYGVSVFRKSVFESLPEDCVIDLADLQSELSRDHLLSACEVEKRFYEIGTHNSLTEFSAYVKQRWGTPNKAIFLDRDGVINEIIWNDDIEQLDSPLKEEEFCLLPQVVDALKCLSEQGYLLFVVTNQPAAAKGKTSYATLCSINHQFVQMMDRAGVEITEVQMCPHYGKKSAHTKEYFLIRNCDCRKPKTGMIQNILDKSNIDLKCSWMVGDSATDIICGKDVGLHTVFIGRFKCDLCQQFADARPDITCNNLYAFAKGLLKC